MAEKLQEMAVEAAATHDEGGTAGASHDSSVVPPRPKTTWTMIWFSAYIAISATIYNFDQNYGGTVLLMQPFNIAFGTCKEVAGPGGQLTMVCQITALQQSLVSLTSLFVGVGALTSSVSGTYLGRRGTTQLGAMIVLIGAAGMLGTSSSFLNYMVCKCIGGVGLGFLFTTTLVYGVECTPPHRRGILLGLYATGLGAGSALAAGVCAGSATLSDNWAWKTPIACQIPLSVALAVGIMFFPESPRWLILKDKTNEARQAWAKFFHESPDSNVVDVQIKEIQRYIAFEQTIASTTSWMEIFHHTNRRRTSIAAFLLIIPGLSGVFFVIPYTAIFLGGLGVSSPFLVTAIINLCVFGGSLFSGLTVEYLGRRLSLIIGLSVMGSSMLIFSTVSTALGIQTKVSQNTLVAFLCIWSFTFAGTISPALWLSSTEMHSVRLRTYGQSFSVALNSIFAFGSTFWTPYMISAEYGDMGTNVGYFYFGLTVFILALTFLFVPETARLKLEQIDDYFESGVPAWKTSLGRNKRIAASNVLSVGLPKAVEGEAIQTRERQTEVKDV